MQAGPVDLASWQQEVQACYEQEIGTHFHAEERVVFPAASRIAELQAIVNELRTEHDELRQFFAKATERKLEPSSLSEFVQKLARHIRKEERELFEGMQKTMSLQELAAIGAALDEALKPATKACFLPQKRRPTSG